MAEKPADKPAIKNVEVGLSVAPTSRSSCQSCKEGIKQGEMRVCFPGRHAGISVAKWLKPKCFLTKCIKVDYAPTGRAKW